MITRLLRFAQKIDPDELKIPKGTHINDVTIQNGLQIIFGIAGAVAFLIIVYAGLKYTLSQGDPAGTAKAKDTIVYAIVGLIIAVLAFAIVRLVVGRVG